MLWTSRGFTTDMVCLAGPRFSESFSCDGLGNFTHKSVHWELFILFRYKNTSRNTRWWTNCPHLEGGRRGAYTEGENEKFKNGCRGTASSCGEGSPKLSFRICWINFFNLSPTIGKDFKKDDPIRGIHWISCASHFHQSLLSLPLRFVVVHLQQSLPGHWDEILHPRTRKGWHTFETVFLAENIPHIDRDQYSPIHPLLFLHKSVDRVSVISSSPSGEQLLLLELHNYKMLPLDWSFHQEDTISFFCQNLWPLKTSQRV